MDKERCTSHTRTLSAALSSGPKIQINPCGHVNIVFCALCRQHSAVAEHAGGHPTDHLGIHIPLAAAGPLTAAWPQICTGHWDPPVRAAHLQLLPVAPCAAEEAGQGQGVLNMSEDSYTRRTCIYVSELVNPSAYDDGNHSYRFCAERERKERIHIMQSSR